MSAIENEIQHLDFPVEKKKERHFLHPIDGKLCWCGVPRSDPNGPRPGKKPGNAQNVTCVDCLHLYIEKGAAWWWDVNRAWYGS